MKRHYIPEDDDNDIYEIPQFEEFLNRREDLIVDRLLKMSDQIEEQFETEEDIASATTPED